MAELLQNAVDAIREKYSKTNSDAYTGVIDIYINSKDQQIHVKDNGIGIPSSNLPELLGPFSSGKAADDETVGEKGVGLTFALFSCNEFSIMTNDGHNFANALVKNALKWKNSNSSDLLQLETNSHNLQSLDSTGTHVKLNKMNNLDIFGLSNSQMKFLIRTKTAIGNTKRIWDEDIDITVNYEYIDKNGGRKIEVLPFEYYNPIKMLSSKEKFSLNEFIEKTSDTMVTDRQKRNMLKDKVVYDQGFIKHTGNRVIKYLAFFIPSRNEWETLNNNFDLIPNNLNNDELLKYKENYYYSLLTPGIFTSVKGMPTGIEINHPSTGNAGYWPNIFILFEDDKLSFDIGRKSIHGPQQNILKKYSKEIFNKIIGVMQKYGPKSITYQNSRWIREEVFKSIQNMRTLENTLSKNTSFEKSPNGQEAQICAMFYEQIGRGKITDLNLYTTGYKSKYDLYGHIKDIGSTVIEFKANLRNIINDFNDEQKLFDEVDCIVCWNVNEADEDKFHDHGITISKIDKPGIFSKNSYEFPNATHKLELSGFSKPIFIIDLKVILSHN